MNRFQRAYIALSTKHQRRREAALLRRTYRELGREKLAAVWNREIERLVLGVMLGVKP